MLERAADALWGPFTLCLLLGLGGVLMGRTGCFVLRRLPVLLRRGAGRGEHTADSPWVALSTALGATMGTGNIVGVATALTAGGPGALLWMQTAALAGMMLKFSEVALAADTRRLGPGPMGYLQLVFPGRYQKVLPGLFAVCCLLASVGMGNMTQSNAAAQALAPLSIPPFFCALFFGGFAYLATGRGVPGVMRLLTWLVPVMTVGYLLMGTAAVWQQRAVLPQTIQTVVAEAFRLRCAAAGAAGYTMRTAVRYGLSRGIFSNEAGMGSSPIAHAQAAGTDPVERGMWGVLEVLIDTSISCTMTALVILTAAGGQFWSSSGLDGAQLAAASFAASLGAPSEAAVSVFVALFALASVCGWFTYGAAALEFLLPGHPRIRQIYRLLYAGGTAWGALCEARGVWLLCDCFTGAMLLLNLPGLMLLSGRVCAMVRRWDAGQRRYSRS